MVVIAWQLDLQLPVQSVHITTKVVSDCCVTPTQLFSAISWQEQVNFQ